MGDERVAVQGAERFADRLTWNNAGHAWSECWQAGQTVAKLCSPIPASPSNLLSSPRQPDRQPHSSSFQPSLVTIFTIRQEGVA